MTRHSPAQTWVVVCVIFAAGLNLRPALLSVSPLLPQIQKDLSLSSASAGLLSSVPVFLFGVSVPMAFAIARKIALPRIISLSMTMIAAAIILRSLASISIFGLYALYGGTIILGVSIGIVNTLVPSLIKQLPPSIHSTVSGVLSLAMCLGAALAAAASEPLTIAFGMSWSLSLGLWAIPALICAAIWLPISKNSLWSSGPSSSLGMGAVIRHPVTIALCIHMALQSFLSHSTTAWLPTILIARGISRAFAGLLLSSMLTAQLVTALSGAWIATIGRDQRIAVSMMYVLALTGFLLCLYGKESDLLVGAILLGLGQGGTFSIGAFMIILRAHDARVALRLNGITQLAGYSIASLGPWMFGMAHDATSTWNFAFPLFTLITIVGMAAGIYVGSNRSIKPFN